MDVGAEARSGRGPSPPPRSSARDGTQPDQMTPPWTAISVKAWPGASANRKAATGLGAEEIGSSNRRRPRQGPIQASRGRRSSARLASGPPAARSTPVVRIIGGCGSRRPEAFAIRQAKCRFCIQDGRRSGSKGLSPCAKREAPVIRQAFPFCEGDLLQRLRRKGPSPDSGRSVRRACSVPLEPPGLAEYHIFSGQTLFPSLPDRGRRARTSPLMRGTMRMDIEKFTERARGFLQAAQTIAIREYHQRVTPEHLLKALLDDEQGAAAGLIRAAGGDPGRRRSNPWMRRSAAIPKVSGRWRVRPAAIHAGHRPRAGCRAADADAEGWRQNSWRRTACWWRSPRATRPAGRALRAANADATEAGEAAVADAAQAAAPWSSQNAEDQFDALKKYARDLTALAREGQARSGDRPRRGDPPHHPGAGAAHQEQSGADRRARRRQDRHRGRPGAAHRPRRRAGGAEGPRRVMALDLGSHGGRREISR